MKKLALVLTFTAFAITSAMAGQTSLTKGNAKLRLHCDSSGCFTTTFSNGKWGKTQRIGAGGVSNYKKFVAKFKAQGWH